MVMALSLCVFFDYVRKMKKTPVEATSKVPAEVQNWIA
jgi:hypothetical protein